MAINHWWFALTLSESTSLFDEFMYYLLLFLLLCFAKCSSHLSSAWAVCCRAKIKKKKKKKMKTSHVNLWCDGDCWIVGKTNREMFWWVPLIFSVPFERSVLHDDRITDGVPLALVSGCVWSLKIGFIFLWSKRSFPDKVHDPQDKSLSLSLAEWSPFRRRTRVQVCFII